MADDTGIPRFPPIPRMLDFPVLTSIAVEVVAVTILLLVVHRFDPTHGPLTVALLIIVGFLGLTVYATMFTVPQDEETATVIGGLVAAFGAVVAFWLGGSRNPPEG